jgi:hypothetical protein
VFAPIRPIVAGTAAGELTSFDSNSSQQIARLGFEFPRNQVETMTYRDDRP